MRFYTKSDRHYCGIDSNGSAMSCGPGRGATLCRPTPPQPTPARDAREGAGSSIALLGGSVNA